MTQYKAEEKETDLVLLATASFDGIHELVLAAMKAYSPKAILLLSDSDEMPELSQGLPEFVSGYVSRHASPQVLQASVRLLLAGGTSFPISTDKSREGKHLVRQICSSLAHSAVAMAVKPTISHVSTGQIIAHPTMLGNENKTQATDRPEPTGNAHSEWEMLGLTPRQYEVLILLARGHSMKMVGRQLNISAATAKAHAEALYQRLDVHNRNAAVYAAVSRGATLGWPSITAANQEAGAWASVASD
ncbi:response regulator transcription factor [Allopusillimonas ginsengisoli]|nr:response regulator transcription factor [Allopusillimonas ginsengisoli]